MEFKEEYMRLAISYAKKGIGAVNPNPLVGAIIVKDDKVIGCGYHARYGEQHAERAAFASLDDVAMAEGAQMYVTLEPCCHYGKQPPCVEAIVEHKIAKVYVGSDDPNEKVAGKGIDYLRLHGVDVETNMLKDECDEINSVFFKYITTGKPYVLMKYAMTMDGKTAAYTGQSKWITGDAARERVQKSRNEYSGIMVGIGTVLADDPMLTCRIEGGRNPVRIVCDTNLRIPYESTLVRTAKDISTIVAVGKSATKQVDKISRLESMGVCVLPVDQKNGHLDLDELMVKLGQRQIDGILLEGGGILNHSALKAGIVNEVNAYIAPKIMGGKDAPTPVEGQGVPNPDLAAMFNFKGMETIGEDILLRYVACNAKTDR